MIFFQRFFIRHVFRPRDRHFCAKSPDRFLCFLQPEFPVQVSPVLCRIMVHPVRRYPERVRHDEKGYFRTGFWSLWLAAGISKTTPYSTEDTCSFPEYAGFKPVEFDGFGLKRKDCIVNIREADSISRSDDLSHSLWDTWPGIRYLNWADSVCRIGFSSGFSAGNYADSVSSN